MSDRTVSPARRGEILTALRQGTVPNRGLGALAIGLGRFEGTFDEELERVARGGGGFKAIRGDYGSGKTFIVRWLQERALKAGFVTSEVQVSETETPLHRLETVYRRITERLTTSDVAGGAFRSIVDLWFHVLEQDVLERSDPASEEELVRLTNELMEERLGEVARQAPMFAAALRAYRAALVAEDHATAEGLLAWASGQPNVAASIRRTAGIKGEVDHDGALAFLQGLLVMLRDSGLKGLVFVLDEVETLQRVRRDVRDKGLNALRQLMDELSQGRFPGLYVVITGTPAFFDGPQGVHRLPPLAQRLQTDFDDDPRFDNPRSVQIRLPRFDVERLVELGAKVRDLFAEGLPGPVATRIRTRVDDEYLRDLARAVAGELGGDVGVAPRIFLRKLVDGVLDRVEIHEDFDPRQHYRLTVSDSELSEVERATAAADSLEEIELDVDPSA